MQSGVLLAMGWNRIWFIAFLSSAFYRPHPLYPESAESGDTAETELALCDPQSTLDDERD